MRNLLGNLLTCALSLCLAFAVFTALSPGSANSNPAKPCNFCYCKNVLAVQIGVVDNLKNPPIRWYLTGTPTAAFQAYDNVETDSTVCDSGAALTYPEFPILDIYHCSGTFNCNRGSGQPPVEVDATSGIKTKEKIEQYVCLEE